MNRVLCFLSNPEERRRRRTAAAQSVCERLRVLTDEVVDVAVIDADDQVRLGFCLLLEIPSTSDLDGAAAYLAGELLSIADRCLIAVDSLEKGGVA